VLGYNVLILQQLQVKVRAVSLYLHMHIRHSPFLSYMLMLCILLF